MAAENESCKVFDNLTQNFACILYGRSENQKQHVSALLDEINNLNFKCPIVTNATKAVLLIHQCCSVVPTNDVSLIEKCCTLIVNLISLQRVVLEGRTLSYALEWAIGSLKNLKDPNVVILKCIESLIRDNVQNIQDHLQSLVGSNGILLELTQPQYSLEIQLWAVKCLEAITYAKDEQYNLLSDAHFHTCIKEFTRVVNTEKPKDADEFLYSKLLTSCLRGIHNVIVQNPDITNNDLEMYLGVSRCYMNYCLYNKEWVKPQRIMPSNMSISDVKPSVARDNKGGKITKQRKQRKSGNKKDERKDAELNVDGDRNRSHYIPVTAIAENPILVISDSDFSDSEQGRSSRVPISQGKVRQAALNLLLSLIKVTDKHTMFGYWSSFLPDGSPSGAYSLNHCILKEPSPRGRIAALNVVTSMLNGSRLYLSQAESSAKSFAFTPFSMILGTMVQELHKCLCSALNDSSLPVLTQALKCLALLVQATPYHRLSAGLVTRVIKCVRPFIRHRDATVQVAAFIVLGCIVSSEPTIPETLESLTTEFRLKKIQSELIESAKLDLTSEQDEGVEYSSDEEISETSQTRPPWLLEKCLRNLGVVFTVETMKINIVPAPVKLESLQVISALCRNYFGSLLASHLTYIAKAMEISLNDKYTDLRLHAGRAIDSIGHAMQLHICADDSKAVRTDKGMAFWHVLLTDPLTGLIQSEHASLRAIGCDCLSSIGVQIYEHLPREKQILIVMLLLSCSRDDGNIVRGAAVRALAISVLYPSLCEDAGFIADTAEAIMRTLNDANLTLRIKSSWSLGNLSDALVLNINTEIQNELPNDLILKLLSSSIALGNDNDKIKSNTARALGNLLRVVTSDMLEKENYKNVVEKSVDVLVKFSNCPNMKVRWNSCYAIGNILKNNSLYSGNILRQHSVFEVLMNLVVTCRNFKVRINAALALSIPQSRQLYGHFYISVWKSLLDALENSQNIEDFTEYKHRDTLVDQICLSLSHLTSVITLEDFSTLHELLSCHNEFLQLQMNRVQERLVPEKSELLLKASNRLNNIAKETSNKTDRMVADMLIRVFTHDAAF